MDRKPEYHVLANERHPLWETLGASWPARGRCGSSALFGIQICSDSDHPKLSGRFERLDKLNKSPFLHGYYCHVPGLVSWSEFKLVKCSGWSPCQKLPFLKASLCCWRWVVSARPGCQKLSLAGWLQSVSDLMCLYFDIPTHRWQKTAWQEEFMGPDGWWELAFCLSEIHACSLENFIFSVHWHCDTFWKFCCWCRVIRESTTYNKNTTLQICVPFWLMNVLCFFIYRVGRLPTFK